ncbi:TonB-dependent receptor [Chloroherpeton thalassium ATCC 35110]|uniref:TonB-dependent receptor n=1 Tax=Chloroherpeton thalassium (strain ATCC 35110 / GB-78) TaxID=517418 RepID=B3QT95_CHLT3|nr:TonB-dependent receptor [Chloroherpeton thalassium]ACF14194.1 TonB-dependent receptor [Chloroherpeton thalassium ATCC 35110]
MKRIRLSLVKVAFVLLLVLGVSAESVFAQTGKVSGRVIDKESAEELIGASVSIVGTTKGALTDLDGSYTIAVAPGKYDLRVSYIGYQVKLVKGVDVKAGEVAKQDILMEIEDVQADEIVVEAELSTATEGALLTERKKSLAVSDGISAEFIKKTPDSDAGDAIKRTTGVSVMGGKYVFVRGLGERYSNTQLNGVNIPSPEPEKRVVPMDIIPASLIENIITIKTFLPDQPGTFAGGLVRIKTKEFPDEFQLNFSASGGFNSNAHFNDIWGYDGGSLDFLGIDDGTRELPNYGDISNYSKTQLGNFLSSFDNNTYLPKESRYFPNQSYSVSVADQINVGELPVGFITNLTYSSSAEYKDQYSFFPSPNEGEFDYEWNSQVATYNVNWGGVLNFSTKLNNDNKLGLKTTYNRTAEDEALYSTGIKYYESPTTTLRNTRLRYVERQMWSTQLSGNHYLSWLAKSELEWKAQYASAKRYEPDNKETQFSYDEDTQEYTFYPDNQRNGRYFSDLDDNEYDFLADISVPFKQWDGFKSKFKFGGLYTSKDREFWARRFKFTQIIDMGDGISPEDLFTAYNVAEGYVGLIETTQPTDSYSADEKVAAGYGMVELPLTRDLRFVGGVRVEKNEMTVKSYKDKDKTIPINGGFDETNVLPSLNLIYELNDQMNVRSAFSQTIANPELRELAPFKFDSYRTSMVGNPYLEQTTIQNYDLRWEWFPGFGELIAVSLFYKNIDKPLEVVALAGFGTSPEETVNNGKTATNYGVEFEFRKSLNFITPTLENFSVSTNITFVHSEITQGDSLYRYSTSSGLESFPVATSLRGTRKMQGQSPYVINVNLSYNNTDYGFSGMLLYNIVGERIYRLNGNPNLNYNFIEKPRNQLDLSLSKTLNTNFKVKLNIKNILNDRYLIMFGDDVAERYKTGTTYSFSLSYAL